MQTLIMETEDNLGFGDGDLSNRLSLSDLPELVKAEKDYFNPNEASRTASQPSSKRRGAPRDVNRGSQYLRRQEQSSTVIPYWEPPYARNYHFTGREKQLAELASTFKRARTNPLSYAITGLGGVGKTQLALEFAYRCQDKASFPEYPAFSHIIWCNADTPETLQEDLEQWALSLNSEWIEDAEQRRAMVDYWLGTYRHYLLILDGADDPDTIREELPVSLAGKVLLTSRASYFPQFQISQPLTLPMMAEAEGLELFVKLGLLNPRNRDENEAGKTLAQTFGNLPLALSQTAAYCLHRRINLRTYLQRYEQERLKVLEEYPPFSESYTKTVADTWRENFDAVAMVSPAAAELLCYASFLGAGPIPEFLFLHGDRPWHKPLSELDGEGGEQALEIMLTVLAGYSLVERDTVAHTFSVHTLVQKIQRTYISSDEQERYREELLRRLVLSSSGDDACKLAQCELLVPHWECYSRFVLNGKYDNGLGADLLNRYGQHLDVTGRYNRALPLYERALDLCRQMLGDEHPDTLTCLNNVASCLCSMGRAKEARPLQEQVLEARRRILGEEHPATIISISNLAGCLKALGRASDALPLYAEVRELRHRLLGEEHPDTLACVNNLAGCLKAIGRTSDALRLYAEALRLRRRVLGDEHPSTLITLNNLASCLKSLGRSAEALPLYEQALTLSRRVVGEEHPDTLTATNNLAACLCSLGRATEARPLHERTLDARRRVLGEEHPDTLTSMNNMAVCLEAFGRLEEARPLHERALEIRRRVLGDEHPSTLTSLNNMALFLCLLGRPNEALPLYERALEVKTGILGRDHPSTITSLTNLAECLKALGRVEEALPLYERVLEVKRYAFGEEHPETLAIRNVLIECLKSLRRWREARDLEKRLQSAKPSAKQSFKPSSKPVPEKRAEKAPVQIAVQSNELRHENSEEIFLTNLETNLETNSEDNLNENSAVNSDENLESRQGGALVLVGQQTSRANIPNGIKTGFFERVAAAIAILFGKNTVL